MDLARVNCVLLLRSVVAVLAVWTGAALARGEAAPANDTGDPALGGCDLIET